MKTKTIQIHGVPVEFTDTPPTRPGNYLLYYPKECDDVLAVSVVSLDGKLWARLGFDHSRNVVRFQGGLWSAPLVPVTEVDSAYKEGHLDGSAGMNCFQHELLKAYSDDRINSRARRVVEGEPINE